MFRALRFAARLGFEIDPGALSAIYSLAPLAESLSAERVARELRGILASPRPDMVWAAVDAGLLGSRLAEGSAPGPGSRGCPYTPGLPASAPRWSRADILCLLTPFSAR